MYQERFTTLYWVYGLLFDVGGSVPSSGGHIFANSRRNTREQT